MHRPKTLWLLLFLLVFLGLGGLYGGMAMLTDPSGHLLHMDQVYPFLLVPDYTLPGLFLLLVMGLLPLFLTYALLARPDWIWAERAGRWSGHHWAWTATMALGVILAIWLFVQGLLIGFRWPIQYITAANGACIILVASLPGVKRYYAGKPINI